MKGVAGLTWGWVLVASLVGGLGLPGWAAELDQQLDIRPHNATEGQARDVADQWLRLGQQQAAEGQPEQAITAWQRAAEIYQALGDISAEGRVYDYLGPTYAELGRYIEAEAVIRRRLAIARDNQDLNDVVTNLNNLGNLLIRNNQIADAEAAFQEALKIATAIPSAGGIGQSLSNLGLVAALRNDLTIAADYYETAANYRFQARDLLGEANSSNSLGDVYRALDRKSDAIGAYRVAMLNGEALSNRPIQLHAIDGLLAIYLERQDWNDVRIYLDRRTALTLNGDQPDGQTVTTLTWLGDYYARTGDQRLATETYEHALALARSLEAWSQVAELTNRLIELR